MITGRRKPVGWLVRRLRAPTFVLIGLSAQAALAQRTPLLRELSREAALVPDCAGAEEELVKAHRLLQKYRNDRTHQAAKEKQWSLVGQLRRVDRELEAEYRKLLQDSAVGLVHGKFMGEVNDMLTNCRVVRDSLARTLKSAEEGPVRRQLVKDLNLVDTVARNVEKLVKTGTDAGALALEIQQQSKDLYDSITRSAVYEDLLTEAGNFVTADSKVTGRKLFGKVLPAMPAAKLALSAGVFTIKYLALTQEQLNTSLEVSQANEALAQLLAAEDNLETAVCDHYLALDLAKWTFSELHPNDLIALNGNCQERRQPFLREVGGRLRCFESTGFGPTPTSERVPSLKPPESTAGGGTSDLCARVRNTCSGNVRAFAIPEQCKCPPSTRDAGSDNRGSRQCVCG